MGDSGLSGMSKAAIAVGSLAAITLVSIAVVGGFKDTGLVSNATADKFIAGLVIFGTFTGVIVLALVGKIIVNLFRSSK